MSEYVAVVMVIVAMMFYLLDLSFRLSDNYDPLKMLLIGVSLFMGAIATSLGEQVAIDAGMSSAIQSILAHTYWLWITLSVIVFGYLIIYLIIRAYNVVATKKNQITMYDDENR